MKKLLQIGDFARLGGVSVKALRFYDEQGLLRPAHADPQSGYRYYTLAQTKTLAQITNLRAVDFSIAEIAALLEADASAPDRAESILQNALAEKRRTLASERDAIDRKITATHVMSRCFGENFRLRDDERIGAPKLTAIADEWVYAIARDVPSLGAPVTEMFEQAEAEAAGARADRPPFLLFHDRPTKPGALSVEVCIPVKTGEPAPPGAKRVMGAQAACAVVYSGDYSQTDDLFTAMTDWMTAAGLKSAGPLREVYHRFNAAREDYRLPAKMLANHKDDFLTELQIPLDMPSQPKEIT
ncbi:MAG: MerR family transcriptional regulator [Pseudomonadota bacterium]